ncbi:MAG TPA: VOC family protein [Acidimicrobiales bacterium]
MTQRENAPEGAPCWIDLWTSDVESSRHFYAELFGWEAEEPNEQFGGYFMFTRDGVPVAGGMGDMGEMAADNTWKIYLNTSDINQTVALGESAGAHFVFPPEPVADLGIQTVLDDATGAPLGAWQPVAFQGFTTMGEHGSPAWFELHTRDYHKAVDFYTRVFHLGTEVVADGDEFRYTTLTSGGEQVAGILDAGTDLGEGEGSRWLTYWYVDDITDALARVKKLGGTVIDDEMESPYGLIATASDPSGALFKLNSASRSSGRLD